MIIVKKSSDDALKTYGRLITNTEGGEAAGNPYVTHFRKLWRMEAQENLTTSFFSSKVTTGGLSRLERHCGTDELMMILSGSCAIVFAPPSEDSAPPDVTAIEAFRFQAGDVLAIRHGVWHSREVPESDQPVTGIMVFAENTEIHDMEQRNVPQKIELRRTE